MASQRVKSESPMRSESYLSEIRNPFRGDGSGTHLAHARALIASQPRFQSQTAEPKVKKTSRKMKHRASTIDGNESSDEYERSSYFMQSDGEKQEKPERDTIHRSRRKIEVVIWPIKKEETRDTATNPHKKIEVAIWPVKNEVVVKEPVFPKPAKKERRKGLQQGR